MAFSVDLIVPNPRAGASKMVDLSNLDEFEDDNPESPLDLARACRVFEANEVRFRITGFLQSQSAWMQTKTFCFFLENLPGLLKFLQNESSSEFTCGMWAQNTETEFFFKKQPGKKEILINFRSGIPRETVTELEIILVSEFVKQIRRFVANYLLAVDRFYPQLSHHEWNKDLVSLLDPLLGVE